jgi:hypothetical protein
VWDKNWKKFISAGQTEVSSFDLIRPRLKIEKDIESLGNRLVKFYFFYIHSVVLKVIFYPIILFIAIDNQFFQKQ